MPNATIDIDRRAYVDYSDVNRPEDFTDNNDDGMCDDGEPYEDINNNGMWDQDRGKDDMGGARDAVLYTVTVSYPRAFPVDEAARVQPDRFDDGRERCCATSPTARRTRPAPVGNCT